LAGKSVEEPLSRVMQVRDMLRDLKIAILKRQHISLNENDLRLKTLELRRRNRSLQGVRSQAVESMATGVARAFKNYFEGRASFRECKQVKKHRSSTYPQSSFKLNGKVVNRGNGTELKKKLTYASTGCPLLDKGLKGGFPAGYVSLVYGQAATGKTTLAMQTSIECARKGFKILYVDSDQSFSHQRLTQMARSNAEKVGQSITVFFPETFSEQSSLIENLENYVTRNVGLIVMDTITYLYRISSGSMERMLTLNRELNRQMAYLTNLALKHGICVLVTSQVHSPLDLESERIEPVARRILTYWSKVILNLKFTAEAGVKEAIVERYLSTENLSSRCFYTITEKGIEGLKH
jgi:DNA repair protein RadB